MYRIVENDTDSALIAVVLGEAAVIWTNHPVTPGLYVEDIVDKHPMADAGSDEVRRIDEEFGSFSDEDKIWLKEYKKADKTKRDKMKKDKKDKS